MRRCDTCSTPLEDDGSCVTCAAEAEGLVQLTRSGFAAVRERGDAAPAAPGAF